MEEIKRGRGRPRLDVPNSRCSRRQAVNSMYTDKASQLISEAATEIPDGKLLWYSDKATWTIKSKDGILEQIGRMLEQDQHEQSHCVYITNLAIAALKNGCTCREIEKAIRKIRMTYALLLRALSRIGINDILIEYGEFGKPYLSGVEGVYFSLSHSGERVMCVLSPAQVGCDVEAVQDRSLSVAERFFAPEEAAYIESIADADLKRDAFFRLWTLKESFVKCLGTGLNLPLDSFSVDISKKDVTIRQSCTRSPVYFREYLISGSYRCAVCGQYPRFGELEIVEIA